jgi:hypothetical protein
MVSDKTFSIKTALIAVALTVMLFLGSVLAVVAPSSQQGQNQETRQAREKLQKAFAENPEAKVAASELPAAIAERIDADKDGFVTKAEYDKIRWQSRGPRDRSDYTMLKDEGFPLNVDPKIVAADDAEIGDGDIVMGVVLNGEPRAYPVNYMNGPHNEVVNDVLGGRAIASTW